MSRITSEEPNKALVISAAQKIAEMRAAKAAKENGSALALIPNHIAVALDCSGSMDVPFPDGYSRETRLDCANAGFQSILTASDPTKTAYTLIAIDSCSTIVVPKTTSYTQMQTKSLKGGGGTDGSGAIRLIKETRPNRAIILTDGGFNDPQYALQLATSDPVIPIDTIAIGEAVDGFLQELSSKTGGIFKRVENKEDLKKHFILLEPRNYLQLTHNV
jgi:hypothetical protein